MVRVICGKKGSGKTKIMLDTANEIVAHDKGVVVFMDPTESHMYNLDKRIRYVDLKEYKIEGSKALTAFILGGLSQNYDIDVIFIDALFKVNSDNDKDNAEFFKQIENISTEHNVDFYISVSADKETCPSYLAKYI
jgi:thymidine kinase